MNLRWRYRRAALEILNLLTNNRVKEFNPKTITKIENIIKDCFRAGIKHGTRRCYIENKCRDDRCVEASREYYRNWREDNPDYYTKYKKDYRKRNAKEIDTRG